MIPREKEQLQCKRVNLIIYIVFANFISKTFFIYETFLSGEGVHIHINVTFLP